MYGDLFQRLLYATRPYEEVPGAAEGIMKKYEAAIFENCRDGNFSTYKQLVQEIVRDYDTMPLRRIKKPRVGVVGEILVKYHPDANNNIVDIIEKEGGEAVVLDLIDFFLYGMYSKKFNYENLSWNLSAIQAESGSDRSGGAVPQTAAQGSAPKQTF